MQEDRIYIGYDSAGDIETVVGTSKRGIEFVLQIIVCHFCRKELTDKAIMLPDGNSWCGEQCA